MTSGQEIGWGEGATEANAKRYPKVSSEETRFADAMAKYDMM